MMWKKRTIFCSMKCSFVQYKHVKLSVPVNWAWCADGHGWWTVSLEKHGINGLRQFEYKHVFRLYILYSKSSLAVFLPSPLLPLFPPNQLKLLWRRLTAWRSWRLPHIYDLVLTRNTCWNNSFFCTESARKLGSPHCVKDISCLFACKLTLKCTYNKKSLRDPWSCLSHCNWSLLRCLVVSAGLTDPEDEDTTIFRNVGNTLPVETTLELRTYESLVTLLWEPEVCFYYSNWDVRFSRGEGLDWTFRLRRRIVLW
jgi:hypothetical protein